MLDSTVVARPMVSPRHSGLARTTGAAGGWVVGIAWVLLGLGLLYAGWFGYQTNAAGERPFLWIAIAVAAGTLVQFLFLVSYGLLLRGMAQLLRRVG